jgi:uncharacterized membrane protein
MEFEERPEPQPSQNQESSVAAELRRLSARVDVLEHELALLKGSPAPHAEPSLAPALQAATPEIAPPPPIPQAPPPSVSRPSLENRLGAQVFNRIGIIALLIGATWFLKLAIDNQWIGPVGRILIGLIAGAGLVLWSERFRVKGFPAFSYSLKAIGTGVLYLSLWASYQLYHLLPAPAVLIGMILVTAWNAFMAWSQNAELLAAYALAGGLATPLLLSTGGNHEVFLFTYLLAIDAASAALARIKGWPRLLLGAFPATVLYFLSWYIGNFHEPAFVITTIFLVLFFAVFASASLGSWAPEDAVLPGDPASGTPRRRGLLNFLARFTPEILLPLGNAAFISLALYAVMQDSDRHWFLPWLMLILAAAYLGLTRLPQRPVPAAMHLSLAVVFLTIAIPLKASGHWITVAWLIEGVALLWVSIRSSQNQQVAPENSALGPANVLRWLSGASLVLGLGGLIAMPFWFDVGSTSSFFNHSLATALIAAVAFVSAAWLCLRARHADEPSWPAWTQFAFLSVIAVDLVAVLLSLREIATSRTQPHPPFISADFATALIALLLLAAVAWWSYRIAVEDHATLLWAKLAGGSIIGLNLIAVFTGVREVGALWPSATNPESELQRALAVSAFLMLYGAALLAIGFWRRTAFIRWQALILLVFTIAKTFLYDMRNLSQGYRVVSFLCLGALLMAVSFAYQKDWLALRDTRADKEPASSNPEDPAGGIL